MHTFAQKSQTTQPTTATTSPIATHLEQRCTVTSTLPGQRAIGEQAGERLVEATGVEAPTALHRFGHDFSRIPIHAPTAEKLQTKLAINTPGDPYEQEADSVADQVMRMAEPEIRSPHAGAPVLLTHSDSSEPIQRLSADRNPALENAVVIAEGEEDEAEQGQVQTLRPQPQTSGRAALSKDRLNSAQGGVPLGSNVRQFMEPRFGMDFSRIQVHADSRAAALSQSINARAFAYGRHIYFNQGEYQPETQEGRRVLAHELTHVIQQGASQTRLPVQQHVAVSQAANGPATIQRLGDLGKALRHNVAPWGSGPTGSDYEVNTDGGSTVTAWRAYLVWQDQLRYWCHGHSLGSYDTYDYSIYSGTPMATVVRDEWTNIAPDQTRAGDIAVWTARFDHSAKFTKPVIEQGQLVPDKSELSTKNGQSPLAVRTLTSIMGTYGPTGIGVFRHK